MRRDLLWVLKRPRDKNLARGCRSIHWRRGSFRAASSMRVRASRLGGHISRRKSSRRAKESIVTGTSALWVTCETRSRKQRLFFPRTL